MANIITQPIHESMSIEVHEASEYIYVIMDVEEQTPANQQEGSSGTNGGAKPG